MSMSQSSPRGRKPIKTDRGVFVAIQHVSKTFQVNRAVALEAITAVGTDPEKLADYFRSKK